MRSGGDELDDPTILEAIYQGALAGVFWKAARLNKRSAGIWESLAEPHHSRASACLALIAAGPSVGSAGPCSRDGEGNGHG